VYKIALNVTPIPADAHMFRIEGWPAAIVVTGSLKEQLQTAGLSGPKFELVT